MRHNQSYRAAEPLVQRLTWAGARDERDSFAALVGTSQSGKSQEESCFMVRQGLGAMANSVPRVLCTIPPS